MAKAKTTDPDKKEEAKVEEQPKEESQPEEPKVPLSEREYQISLNPMKIVKVIAIILLLVGVFYLGRVTAVGVEGDGISGFATGVSALFADDEAPAEEEVEVEAEVEEIVEEVTEEEAPPAEEEQEEVVEEEAESDEPVVEEEKELPPEVIITNYNNVAVSLDDVQIDWKGTWGKITEVVFSIKNNERGTIQPDYIKVHIQGYDEKGARKADIHPLAKSIRSGQKLTQIRTRLSSPYSYSETVVGDLMGVPVVIFLYDAGDNLIMSATSSMNLQG